MTNPEEATIVALREATRAMVIGEEAGPDVITDAAPSADVALAVADMLDAAAHLLRSTDLDSVPRDNPGHRLHAVVHHLSAGAQLARRYSAVDDDTVRPTLPESGINADEIDESATD